MTAILFNYRIPGNFRVTKFFENGNFNNFTNDPRGKHKRCGMATLSQNLIS